MAKTLTISRYLSVTVFKNYDDNGKKVTDEAEQPICVEIPTKVSDVNKAAEMLGKYYALFTDKTQIESDGPVVIIDDIGGEEDGS